MKILIIKTSSLGDIIHVFPVISYLKSIFPASDIDWVVEVPFEDLVRSHPGINRVITVHTKKWRRAPLKKESLQEIKHAYKQIGETVYDVVFDLQGNIKSGILTACSKAKKKVGFGYQTVPEWPNLLFTNQRYNPPRRQNIRADYLFLAQSVFGTHESKKDNVQLLTDALQQNKIQTLLASPFLQGGMRVVVCPGSNWSNKQIAIPTLRSFLKRLETEHGSRFIFIWGTEEEKEVATRLSYDFLKTSVVCDRLPLAALQNLMNQADLVIAMDSLPLHLAGTTSTPTYSVFGASSANKYQPIGELHHAFQGVCPYSQTFEKRCSLLRTCKTGACIKEIEEHVLYQHFSAWWHKHQSKL